MAKFRKKPIVVEAVQWDGHLQTIEPILAGSSTAVVGQDFLSDDLTIEVLGGELRAEPGDWIIRGAQGELRVCKPDVFARTYEPVEEPA